MSTPTKTDPKHLSNQNLLANLKRVLAFERRATAAVIEHLAEVDSRGLHRDEGYSSLFVYCCGPLGMSEAESYARIHAARISRRFPILLSMLGAGRLHLTAIQLIGPKLTQDNCAELVDGACGKSKRQIEEMLAARFEAPAVPTVVRKLPCAPAPQRELLPLPTEATRPAARPSREPAPSRPMLAPLASDRFKVQLTVNRELKDKIETATTLLRHQVRDGDLATAP